MKWLNKTELWATLIALGAGIATQFGVEVATVGAAASVLTWVMTRGLQKLLAKTPSGKRAWATTEFWGHMITAGVLATFPDLPTESVVMLWGTATAYSTSRTLAKAGT